MNAEKIFGENVYVNLDEVIETVYQCRGDEANDEWIKRWFEPLKSLRKISIVHCRECKHRATPNCATTNDKDFCSDGERIEE